VLPGHTPRAVRDGSAQLIEHFDPTQMLRLAIGLKPPHWDEEQQFLKDLQTKGSGEFHHFLTFQEWNERFAPAPEDEQAVVDWAQSQGLTVTQRYPNRLVVDLEAPSGVIEKAISVKMNSYQLNGKAVFSNDQDPSVPLGVSAIIVFVGGLNNILVMRPAGQADDGPPGPIYAPGPVAAHGASARGDADRSRGPSRLAANQSIVLTPQLTNGSVDPTPLTNGSFNPTAIQSSEAYNYDGLQNLGHCCNPLGNPGASPPESSIAIAGSGSVNLSDIAGFQSQYPYLAYNVQLINIDGTPSCPPYPPFNPCTETTMDTEFSTASGNSFGAASDTAKVFVYQGVNTFTSTFLDVYQNILNDGHARAMSTSFGFPEVGAGNSSFDTSDAKAVAFSYDHIFSQMVGQGWTLVAAAGDNGSAEGCLNLLSVTVPADDPNVVAAGGTSLSLSASGIYQGELAWQGLTTTGSCAKQFGGGGGGCSAFFFSGFLTPPYQTNFPCASGGRGIPDIALNAWGTSPLIPPPQIPPAGQNIFFNGSLVSGVIGTSMVAPELAGFFAQENAYLLSLGDVCTIGGFIANGPCGPIGNANYPIYYEALNQSAPHYPFYDITQGCNFNDNVLQNNLPYYCAGQGYDLVTGWGSANMLQLAWAINNYFAYDGGAPSIQFVGFLPIPNHWYNTDQTVAFSIYDTSITANSPNGVAGFTAYWDFQLLNTGDAYSLPTPGTGNSFYSGPQTPNATTGSLDVASSGIPLLKLTNQGCHTAHVEAWDNTGLSSTNSYGPVCYDTISPVTQASLVGHQFARVFDTSFFNTPIMVQLTATDPGFVVCDCDIASTGSGVASTVYRVDDGKVQNYTGPFTVTSDGIHTVTFHSTDVAGNVEATGSVSFIKLEASDSTSVTSSENPSFVGQPVSFMATVTPTTSVTPTGSVTFRDGLKVLGSLNLSGGEATFVTKNLSVGKHLITATYSGDINFFPSISQALTQTVEVGTLN